MLRHAPFVLGLLALAACPSFAVGPEAYALLEDEASCRAARVSAEACTRFELDNGTIPDETPAQPVVLAFGFEAPERNLAQVELTYERPGLLTQSLECDLDFGLDSEIPGVIGCTSVGLAGTDNALTGSVQGLSQGIIEINGWISTGTATAHAISATLLDDNGFESPTVRWEFTPQPPAVQRDDCCAANATPECPDAACADAVCDDDRFCCSDQWDELCAAAARERDECRGTGTCPG